MEHVQALNQHLNAFERAACRASLDRIRVNENYPASTLLRVWGKIRGTIRDYIILQAVLTKESVIEKRYYFSIDGGVTFAKVPEVDAFMRELSAKIQGPFSGDPNKKHRDPAKIQYDEDGNPIEEEEEEEEEEPEEEAHEGEGDEGDEEEKRPPKPKERKLMELERLAVAVQQIERDTCVVPVGAYYLTATGQIVKDPAFRGLEAGDMGKFGSYALFRPAEDAKTMAKIRKAGVANNHDFLDGLSNGRGEWSLRVDESGRKATLRSLLWPGYEFRAEAPLTIHVEDCPAAFGLGFYFGSGEKNLDLAFMV